MVISNNCLEYCLNRVYVLVSCTEWWTNAGVADPRIDQISRRSMCFSSDWHSTEKCWDSRRSVTWKVGQLRFPRDTRCVEFFNIRIRKKCKHNIFSPCIAVNKLRKKTSIDTFYMTSQAVDESVLNLSVQSKQPKSVNKQIPAYVWP